MLNVVYLKLAEGHCHPISGVNYITCMLPINKKVSTFCI